MGAVSTTVEQLTERENLNQIRRMHSLSAGQGTVAQETQRTTVARDAPFFGVTPNLYNVSLVTADTEYTQALPANTVRLKFQNRVAADIRYAWAAGKVATPTAPYYTLKSGGVFNGEHVGLPAQTLYLGAAATGNIVEIEAWQ